MFKWLRNVIYGKPTAPEQPIMLPVAPIPQTLAESAPVQEEYSLSREAGMVFGAGLSRIPVTRYGYPEPVTLPVTGVSFTTEPSIFIQGPKKENAALIVTLKDNVIDFDPQALNTAIRTMLGTIPALAGKINPKQVHIPANHASAWTELKPLLQKSGKFSEHDLTMMEQFFTAQEVQDTKEPWFTGRSSIKAQHYNGKVSYEISAKELPHDQAESGSTDRVVEDYFKQHHDAFLAKIKEKALALGLMEAKDLEHLEFYVAATPWRIEFKLGTKYPVEKDPETGIAYSEMQLADKMTETALAKVDTEKLEDIFTDALLEIGPQLPPITARILDGPLLKKIVHKRIGQNPEMEAVLNRHELFKSEDEKTSEMLDKAAKHMVDVEDFRIDHDHPNMLRVKFDFPDGVSMGEIMQGIVSSKSQMMVAAQPRTGMVRSVAGASRTIALEPSVAVAPGAAA